MIDHQIWEGTVPFLQRKPFDSESCQPLQASSADDWRDAKEIERVRMPGRGFHEAPGATWNLGLHTRPVVASASEIATSLSYGPAEIFTPLIINNHDVFQCFRTLKWSSHVQPCLWSSAGTPLCLRADQGSVQDIAPMVPTWFGSPHLWKSWSLGASAALFFL